MGSGVRAYLAHRALPLESGSAFATRLGEAGSHVNAPQHGLMCYLAPATLALVTLLF